MRALGIALMVGGCASAGVEPAPIAVAAGTFVMGSSVECIDTWGAACAGDRAPHKVRLSAFSIDDIEVSKQKYAACVKAGACPADGAIFAENDDTPALVDDPESARKFCAARKPAMRLPTEAEFEYASRIGPSGALRNYAWGDEAPSCARVQMRGCGDDRVRSVGFSPGDVSLLGVRDLAGSVPEWVDDAYTPFVGCADHLGYGELCWGRNAGCAASRCVADGTFCVRGCIPQPAAVAAAAMGDAQAPVCLAAPDATVLIDPVVRGMAPFNVVRGGGPTDGACAFAGFTRRAAAPKSYSAGFRCALSMDGAARKGATTYRFTVAGCPPNGRVKVRARTGAGGALGYSLDWFPRATTGVMSATAMMGTIEEIPCEAVMVLYTQAVEPIEVKLTTVGNANCLGATQRVTLAAGADTPAAGIDTIGLAAANDCL